MKTDLCADDMVVRLATPQMIVESASAEGGGAAALSRGGAAALACGRRLLLAARVGDTDSVRLLMAKGAPFSTDWLGTSPLHLASANDHVDTVTVLLRAGVSRDARTKVERTPLHVAAYAGHVRVVRALLEAGAAVDARDLLRMTPLHWAVERGHAECARMLLQHGADPHALSKFRKTPLSLAADRPEMRRLVDEAIKENEALRSVDLTGSERAPAPEEPSVVVRVEADGDMRSAARLQAHTDDDPQRPKEIYFSEVTEERPTKSKATRSPPERSKARNERGAEGGGGEGGTAAALLRRHGITLLPTDDGSTVLSALQSGRTVVLSDAGKLMLKESGAPVAVGGAPPRPPQRPATAPAPAPAPAPDLQQQVKLVQVSGQGGEARPAVRIVMNRRNYRKLLLTAARASAAEAVVSEALADAAPDADDDAVVVVPEQFVRSTSAQYLRSQLLCAHAAIQHLARRLRAANARAPSS